MKSKEAGLQVRVDRGLRNAFLDVCRAQDRPAAQVIREFMRDYVGRHGSAVPLEAPSSATRRRRSADA